MVEKEVKTPIFGYEGYVNGKGEICHKTVIVGYKEDEIQKENCIPPLEAIRPLKKGSEVQTGEEIIKKIEREISIENGHPRERLADERYYTLRRELMVKEDKVVVSASRWTEYEELAVKGLLYNQLIKDYHLLRGKQVEVREHNKKFPTSQFIKDKYHEGRNEVNPTTDNTVFHYELREWFEELVRLLK